MPKVAATDAALLTLASSVPFACAMTVVDSVRPAGVHCTILAAVKKPTLPSPTALMVPLSAMVPSQRSCSPASLMTRARPTAAEIASYAR